MVQGRRVARSSEAHNYCIKVETQKLNLPTLKITTRLRYLMKTKNKSTKDAPTPEGPHMTTGLGGLGRSPALVMSRVMVVLPAAMFVGLRVGSV